MTSRRAALLLPAFSLRREAGLGIGDTRSLHEWIDLVADHGVGVIQLLPINEMGTDDSPYNAISSVALEPLYLAMEEVPGVEESDLQSARAQVAQGSLHRVDYSLARKVKQPLLEAAWKNWPSAEPNLHDEFAQFRAEEADWLEDYCAYRWLMELNGGAEAWDQWPARLRSVEGGRAILQAHLVENPERVRRRLDFFAWIQWLCYRQWRQVRQHADERSILLMGDIPIGVSRNSADVYFGRSDFDLDWCGGAPPETVFKHDRFIRKWGQNWGIPLYRWGKMEREGFPWWKRRIRKLVDVFHLFRIDHVLGFYRIYGFPWTPDRNQEFIDLTRKQAAKLTGGPLPGWVPRPDDTKKNQKANCDDGDRRLRMVLEVAGQDAVIGEDLGCVPDYVRPHLYSLGICGFRVPHWDFDEDGQVIPGDEIPETSFATYATHDHDSIPAMWEDFLHRAASTAEDEDDREEAAEVLNRLADFGGIKKRGAFQVETLWKLIDRLMACRSRYAAIMITDLLNMTERINQPGTVGNHNWSLFLSKTAAEYRGDPVWKRLELSISKGGRSRLDE